ncbi:MAG: acetolactate synthase small subunit [Candidatus Diapherotrites archaeon]|nr:acetolactate synthase small subunit [Candidatus Diapherotrites archaeon]
MMEGKTEKKKLRKHIIGVLVEDEPGVLSRLSGLFSRRDFNIDTIIVGKTAQPGVSHIVISLTGDERVIEQVEKQVNKLIDVVKILDLNPGHSVVREHCLAKITASPKTREDLVNICKLHRAHVIDMGADSIIVEVVGKPEKIDNFLELMQKHGVKEVSRTGINAMQRGNGHGNGGK